MTPEAEKRREQILAELSQQRMVRVTDLSARFGISDVSIRRDLERLEMLGLLKRVHGGAVAMPGSVAGQGYQTRLQQRVREKERIGLAAAALIHSGERVIFDSGTTVLQVARHLPGHLLMDGNLTVITSSLPVVRELGPWKGVDLILLGGIYLSEYDVVVGPQTIDNLKGLNADKLILGADGLTFSHGITTSNLLEAEVDQAMVRAAREIIVVADSSKIGVIGLTSIMPLTEINTLITDSSAPADFVARLQEGGVNVILA